jgi:hypothetical protein
MPNHEGVSSSELAVLTGFSRRAVCALAHLREAWCIADPGNAAAIEVSIRALLDAHSLRDIRPICIRVLGAGLDTRRQAEFLERIDGEGV